MPLVALATKPPYVLWQLTQMCAWSGEYVQESNERSDVNIRELYAIVWRIRSFGESSRNDGVPEATFAAAQRALVRKQRGAECDAPMLRT